MKTKSLVLLVAVTLVLVGVAVFSLRERGEETADVAPQLLFSDLAKNLERIDQIEVTTGASTLSFGRSQDRWVVKSKDGYAADSAKLRELLLALTTLRTVEAKTKKPENYDKLGVLEPGAGRSSHQILVMDDKGTVLAGLIAGKTRPATNPTGDAQLYVRKTGDEQAWLVTGKLDFPNDALAWTNHTVAEITANRIKTVTITPAKGKGIAVFREKQGDATLSVKDLPKGSELLDANSPNTIAGALDNLRFDDVLPEGKIDFTKGKLAQANFETFEGVVVSVSMTEQEGKHYAKLSASATAKAAAPPEGTAQPADTAKTTPPAAADPKAEVQSLNTRWGNWVYVVPAYKATALTQGLEAYVKKK